MSDTNTDNSKRKAAILIILKSEDLLTLITKVRSKPIKTPLNPKGYSHDDVSPILKEKKKPLIVTINAYIAMT